MAQLILFVAIMGLLGAINAIRRPHLDDHPLRRPLWLFAMLTAEFIPLRMLTRTALLTIGWRLGALDGTLGRLALWLTAATWGIYAVSLWRSSRAGVAVRNGLVAAGVPGPPRVRLNWPLVLVSYPYRTPRSVERLDDIEYAPGLELDIYRERDSGSAVRPTLVEIHGGGWRGGNRRQQGRPLIHHLAQRGWVCVSLSYPLVPVATFPDQLVAIKLAIAWLKTEGARYGVDGTQLHLTGGSAGAHLGALTALTANRTAYQPGFEDVDTSIRSASVFYGTYDFLNRNKTRDSWPIIPLGVMKSSPIDNEAGFRAASPLDQVHADAPPFLVIHGANDSLIGTAESAVFAEALQRVSTQLVVYAEIPGANHVFDIPPSLRTQLTVNGVASFLDTVSEGAIRRGSSR